MPLSPLPPPGRRAYPAKRPVTDLIFVTLKATIGSVGRQDLRRLNDALVRVAEASASLVQLFLREVIGRGHIEAGIARQLRHGLRIVHGYADVSFYTAVRGAPLPELRNRDTGGRVKCT